MGLTFDRVYGSTLCRAVDTAALAAGIPKVEVICDARLLEIDYGPYEAVPFSELRKEMFDFFHDPEHVAPPNGVEPISELMKRTGAFFQYLRQEEKAESVLVVTHGVAIRAVLGHLTGKTSAVWGMRVDNCVLYMTRLERGVFTPAEKLL